MEDEQKLVVWACSSVYSHPPQTGHRMETMGGKDDAVDHNLDFFNDILNFNEREVFLKTQNKGNSLVVQWLGLCGLTAEGPGSVPGPELGSCKPHGQNKNKTYFSE